jgi:hypothetical protein
MCLLCKRFLDRMALKSRICRYCWFESRHGVTLFGKTWRCYCVKSTEYASIHIYIVCVGNYGEIKALISSFRNILTRFKTNSSYQVSRGESLVSAVEEGEQFLVLHDLANLAPLVPARIHPLTFQFSK